MFYQSSYILIICIASLFVPILLRTKGDEIYVLGCLSILMGCLIQIQSALLSANNKEILFLNTATSFLACSTLFFCYLREKQGSASLFFGYQNKTKCYGTYPICIGSYAKWSGNDSRYRENVSICYVNLKKWCGNVSSCRENISRCYVNIKIWSGTDSRWRENITKCSVNLKKRLRKQGSKARNRIASCRNIIYWLSFIISNFNNCLRVHSHRVYLYDLKKEKDANRITDKYLEKHSFKIILSKSWLNFRDRSPPLNNREEKIGYLYFN
jgi:hypothetical protein